MGPKGRRFGPTFHSTFRWPQMMRPRSDRIQHDKKQYHLFGSDVFQQRWGANFNRVFKGLKLFHETFLLRTSWSYFDHVPQLECFLYLDCMSYLLINCVHTWLGHVPAVTSGALSRCHEPSRLRSGDQPLLGSSRSSTINPYQSISIHINPH